MRNEMSFGIKFGVKREFWEIGVEIIFSFRKKTFTHFISGN